ncbi:MULTISPECIES: hypothetical protein [Bacillus]|uniref:hypothetical protein n=1 Tax=Bacillus TaxID=1386 RepID=UPI0020A1C877|nr:hypothetical protein [Bacillus sp. 1663tsa1]MCP1178509.1 hypothetical protein [Bacillus sp. 1663tsa1]
MRTYTGFEAIEQMKTHWITSISGVGGAYKFAEGRIWMKDGDLAGPCNVMINEFFEDEFTDYQDPIKVDDWICIAEDTADSYIAKVEQVTASDLLVVDETIYVNNNHRHVPISKARKATLEEIAQEKRRRVFAKVGREVDEFKEGDVVKYDGARWFVIDSPPDENIGIVRHINSIYVAAKKVDPIYFVEVAVREDD